MMPETVMRLANDFDNIIGIKEASGDMVQIKQLIQDKPDAFLVISGDDSTALETVIAGGSGVISVLGQGLPREFSQMIKMGLEGDTRNAREYQRRMEEGMNLIFEEGNPAGIKSVFETLGLSSGVVRLPLVEATVNLKNRIAAFVRPFLEVTA